MSLLVDANCSTDTKTYKNLDLQVSKFPSFQEGGSEEEREGGREGGPMRGLTTDHVISGPMRGLEKTASDGPNRQTDMATL